MRYEIPHAFLDFHNVFQYVQNLDEARDSLTPILFKELDPACMFYRCEYLGWHMRNLLKPFVEGYGLEFNLKFINA